MLNIGIKFKKLHHYFLLAMQCCIAFSLTACSSVVHQPLYQTPANASELSKSENVLSIEYLGVQGHLLRFAGTAIMTAPSFTNPPAWRLGPFMPIATDEKKVDKYLPKVDDVEMILVGHAHFDHLMEVPYIMLKHAPLAHAYGSNTMKHSIASAVDATRLHALEDKMATAQQEGVWMYNPRRTVRIMAVESTHAPHFLGINIMTGYYDHDLKSLPWHAFAWKEGQTLAYLIDFLDGEKIVYRLFYQDSASAAPKALVPKSMLDQKAIDIAIITPASFEQVDNYPEYIVEYTKAKHFILGHWEDFFGNNPDDVQRFVRNSNQKLFFERFQKVLPSASTWAMPALFSTQYFAPHGILLGQTQLPADAKKQ